MLSEWRLGIREQKIYKEDYQNLTEALLEEDVSYEMDIQAVEKIQASGILAKDKMAAYSCGKNCSCIFVLKLKEQTF